MAESAVGALAEKLDRGARASWSVPPRAEPSTRESRFAMSWSPTRR